MAKKKLDITKLREAMTYSRDKLRPFRTKRFELIREYVGYHYGDEGTQDRVPVDFMELAVNIYVQQLAARSPRAMVTSFYKELKPHAANFELALNHLLTEIDLDDTFRRVVIDALFSVGIVKIGLEKRAEVEIDGFIHDVGQPFADVISLDNWVHDMTATRWDQCQFFGDMYRLPLSLVKESSAFKNTDKLQSKKTKYGEQGEERTESMSGDKNWEGEYDERVELWDIWLPFDNKIITVPNDDTDTIIREIAWDGPERGPYRILGFGLVPDNIMPMSPASLWADLHELSNRLFCKLGRQAERQKTVVGVQAGAEDDGDRILQANDGEMVKLDNPDKTREYRFGGIDQTSLAFLLQVKDLFAYMGGNIDALGGLSPMTDTVGQDLLLAQNASKRVVDMQDRVIKFAKGVIQDIGFYLWTDPLIELPLVKRLPGDERITIPTAFTAEDREGDFIDYNLDIEPYSMQHQSPQMKLQVLTQTFAQFIAPFAPLMAQQGMAINFQKLLSIISKYTNTAELNDIIETLSGNLSDRPGPLGQMPQKMGTTRHISERVNRPGATRSGKDQILSQILMGAGVQNSEAASIGRPTG